MRKIMLLLALILIVLPLTGCMGMESITAPYGAVPISDLPPAPEGLVQPVPGGYEIISSWASESLFTLGSRTIFIRYAPAPNAAAAINSAIIDDIEDFARQYIESVDGSFEVTTFSFFGQNALMASAILAESTEYGRAGDAAVYVVAPFGDFFVMVSGYAPANERDALRSDVAAFMGEFTIELIEQSDDECDEQPEGGVV